MAHSLLGYNQDLVREDRWDDHTQEAIDDIAESVSKFWALSSQYGFRLMVVVHPHAWEVMNAEQLGNPQQYVLPGLLDRLCANTDIYVVDLLEYFLVEGGVTEGNVWEYYWQLDRHNTPAGYRLLGKGIEAALVSFGMLDEGDGPGASTHDTSPYSRTLEPTCSQIRG